MKILVAGGAGYIGSHAVRELLDAGEKVIVLDNLSKGHREAIDARAEFVEGSVGNRELVAQLTKQHQFDAVMHFAADIEVGESVTEPYKYYRNNFSNAIEFFDTLRLGGVKRFVFSSTAAVYGNPTHVPIDETQPRLPINPYGRSKMMTEMALEDFAHAYKIGFAILRYFNVAGASPDSKIGEDHQPESHLIPRLLMAAADEKQTAQIYGTDYPTPDGTCVRDYVHVVDLARAHRLALSKIEEGHGRIYNIGSANGFSVREVLTACEKVIGRKITVREMERRAGDPAMLVAASERARTELGWKPEYPDLETIVRHAWQWHQSHPQGYRTSKRI